MVREDEKCKCNAKKKDFTKWKDYMYLDFFPAIYNPKTREFSRREYLGLYLVPKPKNGFEKVANSENLHKAEIICANRLNELNKQQIYTPFEKERLRLEEIGERSFLQYFKQTAESRKWHKGQSCFYEYQYEGCGQEFSPGACGNTSPC